MKRINRFRLFALLWILPFLSISCEGREASQQEKKKQMETQTHTNKLVHESSPYLLQHAHNPVDWYPWGTKALDKAKKEDKLLLISIGYAACHWCHVMERESFENEEIAAIMNKHFVCIKVDREERPDIDQIYMNAVQLMTGRGGWPLNCFALSDGRSFFGGTYFHPDDWKQILESVQEAYVNDREKLFRIAGQVTEKIQTEELVQTKNYPEHYKLEFLSKSYENWKSVFDHQYGGNNRAPKFPLPNACQFLLRYYYYTGDTSALHQVTLTLDKMAMGGIFDQVGGGFARYSIDKQWLVPHFEKMLYDNAQLVSLYSEAYQLTKKALYRKVVEKTLAFIERELSFAEGGFFSSLDADSEGEEGKFYVWQQEEINRLLGADAPIFNEYYGITAKGNWENSNILWMPKDRQELISRYNLNKKVFERKINTGLNRLFEERKKRIRPDLDDKTLTSCNALMLKGYVDAYRALGEEKYLQRALKNADFILKHMLKGKSHLHRNYKNGKSVINSFLDDYSFTMEAFVALYQVTFNEQWLTHVENLMQHVLAHFYDEPSGMFYYTSDKDAKLIARKMELSDNVIPSSNSSIAKGLFLLGTYLSNPGYLKKSKQMVANIADRVYANLPFHSNWASLMLHLIESPYELAIVGNSALEKRRIIDRNFMPDVIISGSKNESGLPLLKNRYIKNKTMLYLCKNKTCKLPVTEVDMVLNQLEKVRNTDIVK